MAKLNVLNCLIKAGAQINAQDALGITPLYNAVMNRFSDCVDILVKTGADVNIATTEDETCLMIFGSCR